MNSIGIFLKNKQEVKIENFTSLSGDSEHLVVGVEGEQDKVFLNEDISSWVLYNSTN